MNMENGGKMILKAGIERDFVQCVESVKKR
jgi:hypothetical protein